MASSEGVLFSDTLKGAWPYDGKMREIGREEGVCMCQYYGNVYSESL